MASIRTEFKVGVLIYAKGWCFFLPVVIKLSIIWKISCSMVIKERNEGE